MDIQEKIKAFIEFYQSHGYLPYQTEKNLFSVAEWLTHQQSIISQQTAEIERLTQGLNKVPLLFDMEGVEDVFTEIDIHIKSVLEGSKPNVNP